MDPLDILRKFLISSQFPWMSKIFLHQGGWSVAANSSCVLAFKGEIGEKLDVPPPLPFLDSIDSMTVMRVELGSLLKWVSKFKPSMEVLDVNSNFQGVLVGVNVDLRKLAFMLKLLPPGEISVWDTTQAQGVKSLGFERGPWRGCLAGVGSEASDCTNVFQKEEDEVLFDEMLELESE